MFSDISALVSHSKTNPIHTHTNIYIYIYIYIYFKKNNETGHIGL